MISQFKFLLLAVTLMVSAQGTLAAPYIIEGGPIGSLMGQDNGAQREAPNGVHALNARADEANVGLKTHFGVNVQEQNPNAALHHGIILPKRDEDNDKDKSWLDDAIQKVGDKIHDGVDKQEKNLDDAGKKIHDAIDKQAKQNKDKIQQTKDKIKQQAQQNKDKFDQAKEKVKDDVKKAQDQDKKKADDQKKQDDKKKQDDDKHKRSPEPYVVIPGSGMKPLSQPLPGNAVALKRDELEARLANLGAEEAGAIPQKRSPSPEPYVIFPELGEKPMDHPLPFGTVAHKREYLPKSFSNGSPRPNDGFLPHIVENKREYVPSYLPKPDPEHVPGVFGRPFANKVPVNAKREPSPEPYVILPGSGMKPIGNKLPKGAVAYKREEA